MQVRTLPGAPSKLLIRNKLRAIYRERLTQQRQEIRRDTDWRRRTPIEGRAKVTQGYNARRIIGPVQPDTTITAADFAALTQPIVYVLRSGAGAVLYVGASARGLTRVLDQTHHAIGSLEPADRFDIYRCVSIADALDLERRLIRELKPERNQRAGRSAGTGRSVQRGIALQRNGSYRAFVRVRGRLYSKTFHANTPIRSIRDWRERQRAA